MAQEERDRVKNDLEAKEKELKKAQDEQAQLSTKLQVCVAYHYSALYCMISVYMKQESSNEDGILQHALLNRQS